MSFVDHKFEQQPPNFGGLIYFPAMKTLLASALLLLSQPVLMAQDIMGFLDYRNYFFVFDKGTVTELEPLPPRGFASGGNCMVYASSNGDLKIYKDGAVSIIDQNIAMIPTITDHYIGYTTGGQFKVYDGEKVDMLCANTGASVVEDSVAAFYDSMQRTYSVHYNGISTQAEDGLVENPVQKWSAGDNTIAWVSKTTHEFYVFYHGEILTLASLVTDMPFVAGLDVVAYQDPSDKGLKAFYKGEVLDVDPFMPEKITMGRGLFAYVDKSGALKVFQDGKTSTALDFTPDEYFVKDSLVVMNDKGQCKIYHNGRTDVVVPYWPTRWAASWGTFAYMDSNGSLDIWRDGTSTVALLREPVKDMALDRGLLSVALTNNKTKLVWKGEVFEY